MFKKILFATSATPACDHAARVAFELAKRHGAELIAFHVLGIPTRAFSQVVKDVRTGEEVTLDDDYLDSVKDEIKNFYLKQFDEFDNARIEVATGWPHREILRMARETSADLIIMGASAREDSPYYRYGIPGSTLQRVAKAARCPVLTVSRPSASYWGGFSSVVFATDFSAPAKNAFGFAASLARDLDCELSIFHALDISAMAAGKVMDQEEIEDALIAARRKMHSEYASKLGEFKKVNVEAWEGVPYVEIVKYARERQADLIVLAHHIRETDAERARIGSTMEQVIVRANCPVVSVNRPDKVQDL
ncbi:nucleotide-binding universal stress UspA family protein [Desulfobaculum xiamenense]|uniref:Nucleotide-binding universal stress UspA family protein n=1 Tax=Desulfobaculum xiamenense TaxID=995050 RepID=A0A846QSQ7_9BACT|nr:universal stress protein [Desulfobaculum xiamenense]NJB68485.1 nucleotide-binding universal stress UspA family protein [Desulfobaculum xiamenense]